MKTALMALLMLFSAWQSEPDARSIVKKAEDKLLGESSKGELSMTIVRPGWERTISLKTWSKGRDYSMTLVTAPARDEGTVFLKRKKEIYNWVPSIERTVKLPPSMMMQSWMGSDFTNDDLVEESSLVTDYEHQLLGDTNLHDRVCWKLKLTPKPEAAVVWDKLILHISQKEYLQLRTEFYDENGDLVKTLEGFNIKDLGGRRLPSKMVMTPVDEEGKKTILEYQSLNFEPDIPDGFFTTQNMKRLR